VELNYGNAAFARKFVADHMAANKYANDYCGLEITPQAMRGGAALPVWLATSWITSAVPPPLKTE
jgi:hypothetical protein